MPSAPSSAAKFSLRANPHLYEINTWAWLEELSAKLGKQITLDDVPDSEWNALKSLGFDVIWLMGVWQRSTRARAIELADPTNVPTYDAALPGWTPEDVLASPYSVAAYVPDKRIGTWSSVDRVREKLHARGMALFLDFVGNHTALDHPWVKEHPEYYVQGSAEDYRRELKNFFAADTSQGSRYMAFGKDPYFPPWDDVAQLNLFDPGLIEAHIGNLREISHHCDGVRCDMAMLQLNDVFAKTWGTYLRGATPPNEEFWARAHSSLPNLILLGEVYWGLEVRMMELGFSFAYDKELYDATRDSDAGKARARLSASLDFQNHLARFLENHDEKRCAEVFGDARIQSPAALIGTLPGMRFYHQGELEGRRIHLPITLRRAKEEAPDPVIASTLQKVLQISNEDIFHRGKWNLLPVNAEGDIPPDGIIAYEWRMDNKWKLVVVNLSGGISQGRIPLRDRVSADRNCVVYDQLHDVRYERSGGELHNLGLFVQREAYQAHIFDVQPE